jgi:subtilisin-like proprotein convertase family protein
VATDHPGLTKNAANGVSRDYSQAAQNNQYGGDSTPNAANAAIDDNAHGTAVAGIIAESRWKGIGGHGIAPDTHIAGFNYLLNQGVPGADIDQLTSYGGSLAIDIFNQSWGTDDFAYIPFTSSTYLSQLQLGTTTIRNGKGALYVRAGGNGWVGNHENPDGTVTALQSANGFFLSQNVNSAQDNANPYVIVVSALNAQGVRASYSSPGAAIWVAGTGGEFGDTDPAIVTTDIPGCTNGFSHDDSKAWVTGNTPANGFEWGGSDQRTYNKNCDYTSIMNGTSAATPSVTAGLSLILQANPALTWRDAAYILASTATQVDSAIAPQTCKYDVAGYVNTPAWTKNAAGHLFHNYYGFGRPDLKAAVAMAKTFTPTTATLTNTLIDMSKLNLAIPNKSATGVTSTAVVKINGTPKLFTVLVHLTTNHPMPAELAVELTSPSGTTSVVLSSCNSFVGNNLAGTTLNDAIFRTNAFLDENPNGNWTLRVIDTSDIFPSTASPTHTGAVTDWKLDLYY